jgi:hypothetical protein
MRWGGRALALTVLAGVAVLQPLTAAASSGQAGLKGIYQFTGTPQVDNPHILGGVLLYTWAELEPSPGAYAWTRVDSGINRWASHGKVVAIRIQTFLPHEQATPDWAFTSGVPKVVDPNGSTAPLFWNHNYVSLLGRMLSAMGARYDGDSRITWIQAGLGIYGESKVDSNANNPDRLATWQAAGYTDAIWWTAIQSTIGQYQAAFRRTPVAVAVDSSTFIARTPGYTLDTVLAFLSQHHFWTQYDALTATTSLTNPDWARYSHIDEQALSTAHTGDTLKADLGAAIRDGSTYALIYGSDIANLANQTALAQAAGR